MSTLFALGISLTVDSVECETETPSETRVCRAAKALSLSGSPWGPYRQGRPVAEQAMHRKKY